MSEAHVERRALLRAMIAVAVAVLIVPAVCGEPGAPITVEAIRQAWQARQDRVRTARITWKEQLTEPKGSISSSMPRIVRQRLKLEESAIIPPKDSTVDFSMSLDLDGNKVRYSYEGMEWSHKIKGYRPVKYVSVFDGEGAKDLYPEGNGDVNWPQGIIRQKATNFRDAQLFRLRPPLLAFRGLDPALRPFDIGSMVITSRRAMIGGQASVVLERRFPGMNSTIRLWLDPAREYMIIRHLIIERGQSSNQIDIHYRASAEAGWVPDAWTIVNNMPSGNILDTWRAAVVTAELNNSVDPHLFALEFPPGARVRDLQDMKDWVIKLNGKKRNILPEDIGASYEQMINSEPGEALGPRKNQFILTWPGFLTMVIGALCLGIFIWRRLSQRGKLGPRLS